MLTYLFDASAAVEIYAPRDDQTANRAARYILEQKTTYCQAALFIPNICIAEVFNTLARKYFKPREGEAIDRERYERHLAHFGKTFTGGKRFIPMMSTAITSSRRTGSYPLNRTSLQKTHAII